MQNSLSFLVVLDISGTQTTLPSPSSFKQLTQNTNNSLRQLQELSCRKCPALKQLPNTAQDLTSLRELDLRAPKKQVCKISPEVNEILRANRCVIRGGVVKKSKGAKKKQA